MPRFEQPFLQNMKCFQPTIELVDRSILGKALPGRCPYGQRFIKNPETGMLDSRIIKGKITSINAKLILLQSN
jgi:hypothetical protein